MIKGSIDFGNLRQKLDMLAGPGKESLARRMGVAAGRVFRDDAIINVPVGKAEEQAVAQYGGSKTPGLLKDSMYVAFDKKATSSTVFVYNISWNHARSPHGHWLEFGRWQQWQVVFSKKYGWYTDKTQPLPGQGRWVAGFGFLTQAYHSGKARAFDAAAEAGRREFPKILAELTK